MLFGKYASQKSEARHPSLWNGLVGAWCPAITGPSGLQLYDLSGRNNHGVLTNMDAPTDWSRSRGRFGLDFDGVNDRAETLSLSAGQFLGNQPFSVSVRFRADSFGRVLVARRGFSASTPSEWALFAGGSGTPFVYILDGLSYGNRLGVGGSAGRLTANTWHHMVMTWTGGTTVTSVSFWVDGLLDARNNVDSSGSFASIKPANLPLTIGSEYVGTNFAGSIGEVLLYSRVLQQSEIRALASRSGITFDAKRSVLTKSMFSSAWAPRQNQIIGGGLQ